MKNSRKEFLKQVGLAGLGLSSAGKLIGAKRSGGKDPFYKADHPRTTNPPPT